MVSRKDAISIGSNFVNQQTKFMELTFQPNSFSNRANEEIAHKEMMESPEFINNFGAIFKNEIILHESNKINSIKLKHITKIILVKTRQHHLDVICLCLSVILIFIILNCKNHLMLNVFLGALSFVLPFIGKFFRFFKYKLLIVNKYDFVEIWVDKKFLKEATEIAFHLKNRISLF